MRILIHGLFTIFNHIATDPPGISACFILFANLKFLSSYMFPFENGQQTVSCWVYLYFGQSLFRYSWVYLYTVLKHDQNHIRITGGSKEKRRKNCRYMPGSRKLIPFPVLSCWYGWQRTSLWGWIKKIVWRDVVISLKMHKNMLYAWK